MLVFRAFLKSLQLISAAEDQKTDVFMILQQFCRIQQIIHIIDRTQSPCIDHLEAVILQVRIRQDVLLNTAVIIIQFHSIIHIMAFLQIDFSSMGRVPTHLFDMVHIPFFCKHDGVRVYIHPFFTGA